LVKRRRIGKMDMSNFNIWLESLQEQESKNDEEDLIEELASLEHDQWISWAKDIIKNEDISPELAARWKKLFVPYDELSEEEKDKDRKWAKKVMNFIDKEK